VGSGGSSRHSWIGFGGAGTINITTTGLTHNNSTGIYQLNKFGTGTLNIQVANAFSGRDLFVKNGTVSFNGAGAFSATPGSGQSTSRNIRILDGGTLTLDNTASNVTNRLGGTSAVLTVTGGNLRFLGNGAATSAETTGAMTLSAGAAVFTLDAHASQQLNFTTGAVTRNGGSTLLLRADGLGSAAGSGIATMQGSAATYAFTGQLGGTDSTFKGVLPWAIGDASVSGLGAGFLTGDSTAPQHRPHWGCSSCGEPGNWACRDRCRGRGAAGPRLGQGRPSAAPTAGSGPAAAGGAGGTRWQAGSGSGDAWPRPSEGGTGAAPRSSWNPWKGQRGDSSRPPREPF